MRGRESVEKFTGSAVDQLEKTFSYLEGHEKHFLLYSWVDLQTAVIRCTVCKLDVVEGSADLLGVIWQEWSARLASGS